MQDRRQALRTIGASALVLGLPAGAGQAQLRSRKPPRLRAGDTVGLVKPAGFLADEHELGLTVEAIEAMGLKPKLAPHLSDRFGYLAGQDRDRAADLNAMYADDEVRAVFAVRGGWGSARILPFLDFARIRARPKLLIGFSDITALHLAFAARAGFPTIHGPNAGSAWSKLSWDAFRTLVFEGQVPLYRNPPGDEDRLVQREYRTRTIRSGKATGKLLGLAGVLGKVAGVVFGQCTDCKGTGPSYGGFTLAQVLDQHLKPLGVPAYQGALFGHVDDQFSLPVGARAEIDADAGTIRLLESPVA
jgi:muramoyltetrapeptide carboxypeptidase